MVNIALFLLPYLSPFRSHTVSLSASRWQQCFEVENVSSGSAGRIEQLELGGEGGKMGEEEKGVAK